MDLIDRTLGHDRWATMQLLELSRGLTDEQLDRDFDIGHRTLRETFDHLIYGDAAWMGRFTGSAMPVKPIGEIAHATWEELDEARRALDIRIERWAADLAGASVAARLKPAQASR